MTHQATYSADVDAVDRLQEALAEKRRAMMESEHRLSIMRLQLEAIQKELSSMEGFGLGGLLSRVAGDRESKLRETRQMLGEARLKYDAESRSLRAIQSEIASLDQKITVAVARARKEGRPTPGMAKGPGGIRPKSTNPQSNLPEVAASIDSTSASVARENRNQESSLSTSETPAAGDRKMLLGRAIEAGDEARRDLLSEIETVGTLGRCNVAAPRGVLRMMMNRSRAGTADECAGRVRKSLDRFLGRRREAVGDSSPIDHDEAKLLDSVMRMAEQMGGASLQPGGPGSELADAIQVLTMYLEKRQREAGGPG